MKIQSHHLNPAVRSFHAKLKPFLALALLACFIFIIETWTRTTPSVASTLLFAHAAPKASPSPLYLDKLDCTKSYPVTFTLTETCKTTPDEDGNAQPKTCKSTSQPVNGYINCFGEISIPATALPSPNPTTTKDVTSTVIFTNDVVGMLDPSKGVMQETWVSNTYFSGSYKTTPISSPTTIPCSDPKNVKTCCYIGPVTWNMSTANSASGFTGVKYDSNTGTVKLVDAAWGVNTIPSTNNYNQCGVSVAGDFNSKLPECEGTETGKCAVSMAFTLSPVIKGTPVSHAYKEKETTPGTNNSASTAEKIPYIPYTITGNASTSDPDNFSFDLPVGKTVTVTYSVVQETTISTDCNGKNSVTDPDDVSGILLKINGKAAGKKMTTSTFNNCSNTPGGTKGTIKTTTYTTTYSASNTTTASMKITLSLVVYQDSTVTSPASGLYTLNIAVK